ncbi:LPP20 family lipoprotein [Motiliproteus sp. SC1-56]|uniref:LPP20 family lipoprotein n=1 Tax=Motiliproteus sp. SC1-56 TaxID=2799565 RepID=UPI001F5CF682|nr:hypothetical protein [Motiliproteus sp. SC1-56]
MKRNSPMLRFGALLLSVALLSGCDTLQQKYHDAQLRNAAERHSHAQLANAEPNLVRVTGYAPISLQPGMTPNQKLLNAMRASKLRAYQELAAVVHGQYLFGTTQVRDMVVQDDQFNAAVAGIVRGARVVKAYPVQEDTYATILELDINQVQRAYVDMR